MDIIFEFLVEFIVEVVAGVAGELFGVFLVFIGIGVVVFKYWPFGAAHDNMLIGCAILAMALVGGVLLGRWSLRRIGRSGQAKGAVAQQDSHQD